MYLRRLFSILLFVSALVSCTEKEVIGVDQVEFRDSIVYLNGNPYTGIVWGNDSLWQLTVENGQMTAFTLYHQNGETAFSMTSPADTLQAFDETGASLPIDSFAVRYKSLADEIPALIKRIHGETEEP